MTELWARAIEAYADRMANDQGRGEPTAEYRLDYIRSILCERPHSETEFETAVAAIDAFLASDDAQTGSMLLTTSELDIIIDTFSDGEYMFVYVWGGGRGFEVLWYPASVCEGNAPVLGGVPMSGAEDEVSTREIVELLATQMGGVAPSQVLERLIAGLDEIARGAPQNAQEPPIEEKPKGAHLRLVASSAR